MIPFAIEKREGVPFAVTLFGADLIADYVQQAKDAAGAAAPVAANIEAVQTVAVDLTGVDRIGTAARNMAAILAAPQKAAEAAASAALIAARYSDGDDPAYVAYIIDGSDARNVMARFRRDSGAMEFVWGPALVAELAKADSALAQIAALAANVPTIAGTAAVAALAIRFADMDDTTYVAYLVDGSPDQNVLARWRRDSGALEFVYDELLGSVVRDVTTGVAGSRPSGAKLKGRFRRWGRAGGVTITDSTVNNTALTTRYTLDPASPAPFTLYNGFPVAISGGVRIYRTPPSAGDFGQTTGRMAFMTDAPVVQVSMGPGPLGVFRAYVDGRLESDEKHAFAAGGGGHYPTLTFPTPRARGRRIDVEIVSDSQFNTTAGIGTVAVPPGYRVWAVDTSQRVKIGIFADSYGDGAGSSMNALGYAFELGRMLGGVDVDVLADGRGGTGYICGRPGETRNSAATGYANPNTAGDPLRLDQMAAWGPDILMYAIGTNDDGTPNASTDLKPAALYSYQQSRVRMPVPIIVLGPWPAGSGPSASKIAAEGYIRSAVDAFADPITTFVPVCTTSPKPWWYGTGYAGNKKGEGPSDWMMGGKDGTDPVHPTDNGHRAIAARAAAEILPILRNFSRY